VKFFIGVITVEETKLGVQHVNTETFIDWSISREAALGAWFERVREKHPKARIAAHNIYDATTIAREGFRTGLFTALKHGDDEHQAWLKEAIDAYAAGRPIPAVRGLGTKEKRIAELEARVSDVDERMLERMDMLGMKLPDFTLARLALQGRRWTPRDAQKLRDLIDAGEIK
jgi:hypothetical protein